MFQKYNRSIVILWRALKTSKKKNISQQTYIYIYRGHRHFEVLWSFILCILWRFVLSLKNSHYVYISLYIYIKHSQHYEMRKNKSQNVLFHSPNWASAEKVRLHYCHPYKNYEISKGLYLKWFIRTLIFLFH